MKYKTFIICFAAITLAVNSFSADFKSPHKLKAGDVLSADVFNEIIEAIEIKNATMDELSLVGDWSCTNIISRSQDFLNYEGINWFQSGNVGSREDMLSFHENLDGTYGWSSSNYDVFFVMESGPQSGTYDLANGFIIVGDGNGLSDPNYSEIEMVSPTRFKTGTFENFFVTSLVCDKMNLPPETPNDLGNAITGDTVTLNWIDASTTETGFVVYRRDTLEGQYQEIGSVGQNVSTYQDQVPNTGTYWYRIKAVNQNGHSYGSNVIKVEIN